MSKKSVKKKKAYKNAMKQLQRKSMMNQADGKMVGANQCKSDSMKRDYFGGIGIRV